MKNRIYTLIAAALVVGAIFYSGSAVLSQSFGRNPIQAGAAAAKPNGVPTCLAACPAHDDPDGDNDDPPAAAHPVHHHAVAKNKATVQQTAVATATGKNAVAIAQNRAVVHQVVHQKVVVRVVHPQVAAAETEPDQDVDAQPVATTQAVALSQPAPQPVPAQTHLPATGDTALNTAVGTSAMVGAGILYWRSRRLRY